jgi:hypothetical protein
VSFEEFEASTYKEPQTGIYIVDGDTPILNLQELESFYQQSVLKGGLIVHQSGGVDAAWSAHQKINITYCVSTGFGSRYAAVRLAMADAAAAWEMAADVNFVHIDTQDTNCTASNPNVIFDVNPISSAPYLARAFFPNYPRSARNVLVDSSAFGNISPLTLTGVLQHELGHALGFRHEHTRPEAGTCFEDSSWRPLTGYDSASVMHYPQCNGANAGDLRLTLSDKQGAAMLYGLPKAFTRALTAWDQPETSWGGYTLHVADVSGDGRADLVWNARGTINRTYVALSNGNGTFSRALTAWDQPETGWSGYTLHVADVSGDGRADLVWSGLGTINRTYVALSNGNGTFSRALTAWDQPETGWGGYTLHVADISGDGRADLVWNARGTINRTYVALSNGNGTFSRALTAWDQPETGWSGYTLHVVDVSGDGRADFVWSGLGTINRTYVALSNGNGTFSRALTAWDQPETSWGGYTLHVVDVSGDGRADLVWNARGTINRTYVALSNGNGAFSRALTAWDQPETGWGGYTLHVADVSGDGRADLVWSGLGTINRTYVALSNGNGTFSRTLTAWDQPETSWGGYTLHVVDVSGDGRADLVWNGLGTINRTYSAVSELR